MKNLIQIIMTCLTLSIITLSQAGEVTVIGSGSGSKDMLTKMEVLKMLNKRGISRNEISNNGMKIFLGEFTGIGKKLKVDNIRMLLTKKKVFFIEDVEDIRFKDHRAKPTLSNISSFELENVKLTPKTIKALILK